MTGRATLLACSCFFVFAVPSYSQGSVDYGVGVRSSNWALKGTCIDFDPPTVAPRAGLRGKTFQYSLLYLENLEQVRDALEISASASARGLWGSASASASFFKELQFDQYGLYMLVKASIRTDAIALRNPRLRAGALSSLDGKKLEPAQFVVKCGDQFVSALEYGGSIYGLIVVNTSTRRERDRLQVSLQGAFNAGISADLNAQRDFSRVLANKSYHITYLQEGGTTLGVRNFTGILDFFSWASTAENTILENPAVMRAETLPYTTIDPSLTSNGTRAQLEALRLLGDRLTDVLGREKNIAFIATHRERFPTSAVQSVIGTQRTVKDLARDIGYLAEDCNRDETRCDMTEVNALGTRWSALNTTPLPEQNPLYGVFDFPAYEPRWRDVARNAGSAEHWQWRMLLGDVDITDSDSRLNYNFICERTGYYYNGGGGNDHQFAGNVDRWPSKVTADLIVKNGVVSVSNVTSHLEKYTDVVPQCEQELIDFVKSKDRTPVL